PELPGFHVPLAPADDGLLLELGIDLVVAMAGLEVGLADGEPPARGVERHRFGNAAPELPCIPFGGGRLAEAARLLQPDTGGDVGNERQVAGRADEVQGVGAAAGGKLAVLGMAKAERCRQDIVTKAG